MKRFQSLTLLAFAATAPLASAGCKKEVADASKTPAATTPATDPAKDDMAKLPNADYAAAVAQRICPVTDEPLGSMGTPIKVTLEGGREVFLCCEGCVDAIKADPAKYLAKLDAAKSGGDAKPAE